MPSSHWGIGFAFGLVVALCLSIFWVVALSPPVGHVIQTEGNGGHSSEQTKEGSDQQPNLFPSLEPYGVIVTPADTFAQWIMAALGLIATGLSGWAVILLKRTLSETKVAANAAQDAVAVTREVGERQLRAYVGLSFARFTPENQSAVVNIGIKNFGQTPATNVVSWTHTWVEQYPLAFDLPLPDQDRINTFSRASLPPQIETEHFQPHGVDINAFSRAEIIAGRAAFYAYGEVQYDDAFGIRRSTKYLLFCRDISGGKESRFAPYHKGNSET